jgi:DNA-binding transcriptional MerR regulator
MQFENLRQWQGTAETLTKELKRQINQLGLSIAPPEVRTIRLWRSKQLFSQPKREKFGFRQILEGLAIALLLKKGWTLAAIGQVLPTFPDLELEQQILAESENQDPTWVSVMEKTILPIGHREAIDRAEDAIVLLAQGILKQYKQVLNKETVRQDDRMPAELYNAMCKLGRLYIEEGLPDEAACIHTVLDRSRYSVKSNIWKLEVFRQPNFRFSDAMLIEPELRVPTSECAEIAYSNGGFGEDNVIEYRLYQRLKQSTEQLGARKKHKAYTALRELVARKSLIRERELWDYLDDHELNALQGMIIETFFDPVPDIWLINGQAHRCAYCNTLMRPDPDDKRFPEGRCPIRQCNGRYQPKVAETIDPAQDRLLIAKPQILAYWTGPGIDELEIFDAARNQGLTAELYPESDLCDVSIDHRFIGIDAKSYQSPVSLALRLNRSIGGLIHYRRRIIAISDRLIEDNPSYLSTLRSTLDKKGNPSTLKILPVSSVISGLGEL